MVEQGYYRFPDIRDDKVVFISEDDIWVVDKNGGVARRITTSLSFIHYPKISPDGKWIAFSAQEEGYIEIYLIPFNGGEAKRLTHLGAHSMVLGWSNDSKYIYFSSAFEQAYNTSIYKIQIDKKAPTRVPVGYANRISFGKIGTVIGRHTRDTARWKRYKGGTAGELWIDEKGDGNFVKLINTGGNLDCPMWINNRIYFISDHEGIANIYSCTPKGRSLKRHTNHGEYYVRNASTDGKTIVYHSGADLYILDVKTNKYSKIEIEYYSTRTQTTRKFINPVKYLDNASIHPQGTHLAVNTRGKAFYFANWSGAVLQIGNKNDVEYKLSTWLADKKTIVTVSDELNGEERLLLHNIENGKETLLADLDLGIIWNIAPSPTDNKIAVINHKNEIHLVDCDKKSSKLIDKSDYERIGSASWSPDGKFIAYSFANTPHTRIIKIADTTDMKTYQVTNTFLFDDTPIFTDDGKYLLFIGARDINPVVDAIQFELAFMKTRKPFLIPLKKDIEHPFRYKIKQHENQNSKDDKTPKKVNVEIDFEDIEKRITPFPMKTDNYFYLQSYKNKVFIGKVKRNFISENDDWGNNEKIDVIVYDFDTLKEDILHKDISGFELSQNGEKMLVTKNGKLFVYKSGEKPNEKIKNKFSPEGGAIKMDRIKPLIYPKEEWKQMYRSAWILQREHFWTPNMSNIDWEKVYKRYLPLLDRAGSRAEFSDIIWEMQGELGTSHCYEFGGDYRKHPNYSMGKLGCKYELSKDGSHYIFAEIYQGESSKNDEVSPLIKVNIKNGDKLYEINGKRTDKFTHPKEILLNHADEDIILTIKRKGERKKTKVIVKTLKYEWKLLYRTWVEKNREYVHKKSMGKLGYIHIPDMSLRGFAEFHRYYLSECRFEGLVVDVRYNGGGFVSQLILEKLNRKIVAYAVTRWSKQPETYPSYAIKGPIVAITNEFAGSDGDIFSHNFKLMKLGKLIGKRTWGGVIGINGQYHLADRAITTQPEYSFWFKDVGWKVENYGTDPDIEVDITPQDYENNLDPQLDKAIEVAMEEIKKHPYKPPKFGNRPDLSLPKLSK